MLRKILGALFSRWTLLVLLVLVLCVVVWQFGELLAIGEVHPLESERSHWIACATIVGLVVLVVVWRRVQARRGNTQVVAQLVAAPAAQAAESPDLAAVRERFEQALQMLRRARFGGEASRPGVADGWWQRTRRALAGKYLYELPWYLIIGAPGTGKTTALKNAGLQFPLAAQMGDGALRGVGGTRSCEWWFTDRAVLIDTAGRFTTQDSDQATDKATWGGFLGMLRKARARQPLNGVLVTVAAPDLLVRSGAERQRHALTVRARLQELHEQLGIRFPIYLLVTKCDLMAGFAEYFSAIDKAQRATPWGITFEFAPQAYRGALAPRLDDLLQRLDQGLVDRLQAEADPTRRARIYGFPNQFAELRAPLAEFVEQVFAPSPFEADPQLRGLYFVSGTQEGTPIDRVLGAVARRYRLEGAMLAPQRASGRSYFLERLLTELVFVEQGLAGTNRGYERKRQLAVAGGYAALGVLGLGMMALWWTSWRNNARYIEAVDTRVETVARLVQQTPNRASTDLLPLLPALQATRSLALTGWGGQSVPWSMGFGLFQGNRLDSAARYAYEQMLHDAMLPRLALRFEEQLRLDGPPESQYESLKSYLMMYDIAHFDAEALKSQVVADWDQRYTRTIEPAQRQEMADHVDALLAAGAAVSPLPRDQPLVDATRTRIASVALPQRVYNRMRVRGLGSAFPDFDAVKAGGANAPLVFQRASGLPLTKGVPGLYTYRGYHEGLQSVVDEATKQLEDEQGWVLGVTSSEAGGVKGEIADKLVNDVRRLYLNDYRDTWKAYIADIRLIPPTSTDQAIERTRFLAAPDSPLVPLLKAMSRETTLLGSQGVQERVATTIGSGVNAVRQKVLGQLGGGPTQAAPGERIESIVDDQFTDLRRITTPTDGGKAPVEAVVGQLGELQVALLAAKAAIDGGGAPPASPLPNQLKAQSTNNPEPLRSVLDTLGTVSGHVQMIELRSKLGRDVQAQIGDFCSQAINGRYPFDPNASREVTPADFAALFGPGGRFEREQQQLAPWIDTGTRPWSFRANDGNRLGGDSGTLPQFQRAAAIRDAFFSGGTGPSIHVVMKPVEMDAQLREFVLDVDGQIVRYDHGPQIPQPVNWPGPRGTGVVRVSVQPAGGTGLVTDGPWALSRMFDRVGLQPGAAPEKFRATFDIDGRKAIFDVTASSVRNPLGMQELRSFSCPNGL